MDATEDAPTPFNGVREQLSHSSCVSQWNSIAAVSLRRPIFSRLIALSQKAALEKEYTSAKERSTSMKKLFTLISAALLFFAGQAQLAPYYTNADANTIVFKQSLGKGPATINLISNQVNGVINIKINNPYSARYEI